MFGFSDVGWSFYRHTNSGRLQHDGRGIKTGHLDLTDVCEWIFNFTVRCAVWCHWGWIVILQTHVTNSRRLQHRGRRVETGFLNALTDVSTWLSVLQCTAPYDVIDVGWPLFLQTCHAQCWAAALRQRLWCWPVWSHWCVECGQPAVTPSRGLASTSPLLSYCC